MTSLSQEKEAAYRGAVTKQAESKDHQQAFLLCTSPPKRVLVAWGRGKEQPAQLCCPCVLNDAIAVAAEEGRLGLDFRTFSCSTYNRGCDYPYDQPEQPLMQGIFRDLWFPPLPLITCVTLGTSLSLSLTPFPT